jgi:hypothetical protein
MKDFQKASSIRVGQHLSVNTDGEWSEPRQVLFVQHNRLVGRTPRGEQIRGVVALLTNRIVVSMDDDETVRVEEALPVA